MLRWTSTLRASPAPEIDASGLTTVPPQTRQLIVSGMRWTLWLSLLAAPFSYGSSILLARTGQEVIGTYGLLIVYVSVVSTLFYLGGDAVVMKFVPELSQENRLPFLLSYLLTILGFWLLWLAAISLWPGSLHYLFGAAGSTRFQLTVICLSPIYIGFSLISAAHKAVLDTPTAQIMVRSLTLGSFVCYAALFLVARPLLAARYAELIWGIYLGLTLAIAAFALAHLLRMREWRSEGRVMRLFLPAGFWAYTLSTEQVSATNFFLNRLDLLLVVNFGGVELLGKYVAILTLAEIMRTGNRFFLDTLLPSLTNLLAAKETGAAAQLFSLTFRLLLLVNLATTTALLSAVPLVLRLLGPQYLSLRPVAMVLFLCSGLAAPSMIGGILLSGIGKPQRAFWVGIGQLAAFLALFSLLWPKWRLLGAASASGGAVLLAAFAILLVSKRSASHIASGLSHYITFLVVGLLAAIVSSRLAQPHLLQALGLWAGTMVVFLYTARYSAGELRQLLACFVPQRVLAICRLDKSRRLHELGRGWEYRVYDQGNGRVLKIPRSVVDQACRILSAIFHDRRLPAPREAFAQLYMKARTMQSLDFVSRRLKSSPPPYAQLLGNFTILRDGQYTQDKVTPITWYLSNSTPDKCLAAVWGYVGLVHSLWRLGLSDRDLAIWNCGVDGDGTVVQVDITSLTGDRVLARDSVLRKPWLSAERWTSRATLLDACRNDLEKWLSVRRLDELWGVLVRTEGHSGEKVEPYDEAAGLASKHVRA